jgi:hypothetical protein
MITDMKTFTTKEKKIIEYYPNNIINNINNPIFNEMITKKKDYMSKGSGGDDLDNIKFI